MLGERARELGWLLPPVVAGMGLRLLGLSRQLLGGDEIHAVRFAWELHIEEVLFTYKASDFCQPLTALYKLGRIAGLEWSEMGMRVPILVAALAVLVAGPWIVRRRLGRETAAWLAWLLALSPLLVLYGRIIRSYTPIVLLSGLAVTAFWVWWRGGDRRHAWAYAVLAPLAVYFHLVAAPMVAAPFLFAAGELVARRQEVGRRLRGLAATGLGALAGLAAFLVPAWSSLREVMASKQQEAIPAKAWLGALQLQAGTSSTGLTAAFWALALVGLGVLLRRERALAVYTLVLVAAQVAGVLLMTPLASHIPVILNRYLLVLTPIVLLWTATALAHPWLGEGRRRWRRAALVVWLGIAFFAGPLADGEYRWGSFTHSDYFLAFDLPRARLDPAEVPAFYLDLAREEPGEHDAVLEVPGTYYWRLVRSYALYQKHHRRPVLLGIPYAEYLDGYAFRGLVRLTKAEMLASSARYLVIHRQPLREVPEKVREADAEPRMGPELIRVLNQISKASHALAGRVRELWGPPIYEDEWIWVWDLDVARSSSVK